MNQFAIITLMCTHKHSSNLCLVFQDMYKRNQKAQNAKQGKLKHLGKRREHQGHLWNYYKMYVLSNLCIFVHYQFMALFYDFCNRQIKKHCLHMCRHIKELRLVLRAQHLVVISALFVGSLPTILV